VTHLAADRALAMRTLMPRAFADRTTNPAAMYAALTRSGRAEVDRLVDAFREVRQCALDDLASGLRSGGYEPAPEGYPHFHCENLVAAHVEALRGEP
jgi:hypothetical protein